MARNRRLIDASPSAVFEVLSDPRSYAYWVIGSREVRDMDPDWPRPGSRFAHTVNIGPLRVQDYTSVEEVEPDRRLQLRAKARPFGTARVELELEPADGEGTRVTIVEQAADPLTAFIFQPLTHLAVRRRNARSLERLAELAEGRKPMPGDEPEARARRPGEDGTVVNPALHDKPERRRRAAGALARGAVAGLAGAAAMSVSTNVEMRARGRSPSDAPAKTIERLLGTKIRGRRKRMRAAAAGHVVASLGVGLARGAMDAAGVPPAAAAAATAGLAMLPELVVVPATGAAPPPWRWSAEEAAISILHHGVYAGTVVAVYATMARPAAART
jgi:uncharacterized protein YndB with AHSA1/START domain